MIIAPYVGLGRHELGAWDVPAAKLSPPGPLPPGTGLLHLLTFNGATAFRRWKRPVPRCPFAVYLLPLCCPFNGATAFRRWKLKLENWFPNP